MTTLRVRLRTSAISQKYPFKTSYLVARDVPLEHYYKRFGPCFSAPLSTEMCEKLRTLQVEAQTQDRVSVPLSPPEALRTSYTRVVVPLETNQHGEVTLLHSKIDARVNRHSSRYEDNFSLLRDVLPPEETFLHLRQGTTNLCVQCPQVASRLAGICTPGCGMCHNHLRVRIDPRTYHPA
jgi:hypothetical protein